MVKRLLTPEQQEANRQRVLKWQKENRERVNAKNRAWRAANPGKAREYELAKRAKDPERYKAYYRARQRRVSGAINPTGETRSGRCENSGCTYEGPLVWDHCHETGLFRGWLCDQCNKGLGHFEDRPERILGIAQYAQKFLDRLAEAE